MARNCVGHAGKLHFHFRRVYFLLTHTWELARNRYCKFIIPAEQESRDISFKNMNPSVFCSPLYILFNVFPFMESIAGTLEIVCYNNGCHQEFIT
jgi:hypothetical protein